MKRSADAVSVADRRARMSQVKRLVVKIGSSSLAGRNNTLDRRLIKRLVEDVVVLRERGVEVSIVTSGAVVAGMGRLGLETRPRAISALQATAAVGQNLLMHTYKTLFDRHQVASGQVLLTAEDILYDRRRYLNLENTFRSLFAYGVVPIINENDSVAVAELRRTIGENDMLAAYVANMIGAQLLVILSDVEGLYSRYSSSGPKGELMRQVEYGDEQLDHVAGKSTGEYGRGGMETKIRAARLLMACGEMTIIAHARKHRLGAILAGEETGTLFIPSKKRLQSRKRWIAFASPCKGHLVVDKGARSALVGEGKSLLPAGVVACEGHFGVGEMVRVEDEQSTEMGRGLSRYTSDEIRRILGKSSPEVEKLLGRPAVEVIHRDDLVLLDKPLQAEY
jgi:glutamate 5-kinase